MVLAQRRSLQADSGRKLAWTLQWLLGTRREGEKSGIQRVRQEREGITRRTGGYVASLVPDHVLLVDQKVNQLDAVTHGELGVLGHGQDGPDRPPRFQVLQGRDPEIEWLFML